MPTLPKLSIAAKLYTIFTLLAVAAIGLAGIAVMNARHQAAMTGDYETSLVGTQNVERVNGLIYAVVMESRGIYMSPDIPTARRYGDLLLKFNERIVEVVDEWRKNVRTEDAAQFDEFSKRIAQFIEFRKELVRARRRGEPRQGPRVGRQRSQPQRPHGAEQGSRQACRDLRCAHEAHLCRAAGAAALDGLAPELALAVTALALAAVGVVIIGRAVTRPLGDITRVTGEVAGGAADVVIPYVERHDEVGAVARSIRVFQQAMERNAELNRTVAEEAKEREARNASIERAVESFRVSVEQTLGAVGTQCRQMRSTAQTLTGVASNAADQTGSAAAASDDTTSNVNTVASASEELTASIQEIARHVAQATTVVRRAGRRHRVSSGRDRGPRRRGAEHRRGGRADPGDRGADQSAGAQRHDRGGARRRSRPRLRGGRPGGEVARRPDREGDRGDRPAGRRIQTSTSDAVEAVRKIAASMQEDRQASPPRSPPRSRSRAPRRRRFRATPAGGARHQDARRQHLGRQRRDRRDHALGRRGARRLAVALGRGGAADRGSAELLPGAAERAIRSPRDSPNFGGPERRSRRASRGRRSSRSAHVRDRLRRRLRRVHLRVHRSVSEGGKRASTANWKGTRTCTYRTRRLLYPKGGHFVRRLARPLWADFVAEVGVEVGTNHPQVF